MRPETGVMQFGDDWPGVFIRGDNAFGYWQYVECARQLFDAVREGRTLSAAELRIGEMGLKGLADLLTSCDVRRTPEPQMVKPWSEAKQ